MRPRSSPGDEQNRTQNSSLYTWEDASSLSPILFKGGGGERASVHSLLKERWISSLSFCCLSFFSTYPYLESWRTWTHFSWPLRGWTRRLDRCYDEMHYEGCFGKAIAFLIGYYAFPMGDWAKNVPRIVPRCNSRQNRPSLPRNLLKWPMYKVIITDFQNLVQFDSYRPYRPFWHDVTSAMFASQNNRLI